MSTELTLTLENFNNYRGTYYKTHYWILADVQAERWCVLSHEKEIVSDANTTHKIIIPNESIGLFFTHYPTNKDGRFLDFGDENGEIFINQVKSFLNSKDAIKKRLIPERLVLLLIVDKDTEEIICPDDVLVRIGDVKQVNIPDTPIFRCDFTNTPIEKMINIEYKTKTVEYDYSIGNIYNVDLIRI